MTQQDIDHIEGRLGVRLPSDYCTFMTSYPQLSKAVAGIAQHEILSDARSIIRENERVRAGELPLRSWPHDLFVIGDSGCGDYYCLDLSESVPAVVCWNHETGDFEETAPSLRAFLQQLIAS